MTPTENPAPEVEAVPLLELEPVLDASELVLPPVEATPVPESVAVDPEPLSAPHAVEAMASAVKESI